MKPTIEFIFNFKVDLKIQGHKNPGQTINRIQKWNQFINILRICQFNDQGHFQDRSHENWNLMFKNFNKKVTFKCQD